MTCELDEEAAGVCREMAVKLRDWGHDDVPHATRVQFRRSQDPTCCITEISAFSPSNSKTSRYDISWKQESVNTIVDVGGKSERQILLKLPEQTLVQLRVPDAMGVPVFR